MRRIYLWSLLTLLAMSVSAVGCDDDTVVVPPVEDKPVLTLGGEGVDAEAAGGEFSFTFKVENPSGVQATAAADADWVEQVTVRESRATMEGTVSFTVAANETEKAREAKITVKYAGAEDGVYTVRQAGRGTEPDPGYEKVPGKINEIDAAAFRYFVWDYEAQPDKFVFKGDKPCIVDVATEWCGACQQMAPILEKLAGEFKDQIDFFYVNGDKEPELTKLLNVTGYPTMLFIPMKGEPARAGGAMSEQILRDMIDANLLHPEEDYDPSIKGPELANEYWAGDADKRYTHMRITAFLKCTSKDAVTVKVGVYKKDMFEQLLQEHTLYSLVNKYGQGMESEVIDLINGEGTPVVAQTMPEDTHVFVILARNANGGVTIEQHEVTNTADYSEPIDFQAACQDETGHNILLYVKSGCAEDIRVGCVLKTDYQELTAQGKTTQDILMMEGNFYHFQPEDVANALSESGCMIEWGGCIPGTSYMCLGMVTDADGKVYTKEQEVVTRGEAPVDPDAVRIPELSLGLDSEAGAAAMTYSIRCLSQDAAKGSMLILPTEQINSAIVSSTLEDLMTTHAEAVVLTDGDLSAVNGEGKTGEVACGDKTRYTLVADVANAKGGRIVCRADHQLNRQGAPVVSLRGACDEYEMRCTALCVTGDAVSASIAVVASGDLMAMFSEGETYETVCEQMGEVMDADNLGWLNNEGNNFALDLAELPAGTRYTWILDVKNEAGMRTTQSVETVTPAAPTRTVAAPALTVRPVQSVR